MGEVHLARDNSLGRQVAIKLLPESSHHNTQRRKRFLREARAASGINHPNICTIHEIGTSDDGRLFIVMEYLDGSTLASRIRLGRPNSSETLSVFIQIAEGLNAAHQAGVIHRDIKPSNVSIDADGHLKLLDFGLAKSSTDDDGRVAEAAPIDPTTEGHIVGTPNYMSPEQATGAVLDARTDIYSAAVTILELITGENPFAGRDFSETTRKILSHTPGMLREKNPAVHPRLERIVVKCLEKSPQDRYRTAAELLSDLRSLDTRLANFESTKAGPLDSTIDDPDTDAAPASESDVFISFSSVDNQPLTTSHVGWVTQFFRDLQIRVQQITGEEIVVSPHAADSPLENRQRSTVLKEIPMAKTMVAIVSPPYIKSPECRSQIEQYWDSVASETGSDARVKPRLLKVVKRPFEEKQTPEPLRVILPRLTEFNFFERNEETGRLIEYDEAFGETAVLRTHL